MSLATASGAPEFLTERSPGGLTVHCLTPGELPSCHIYMEAQIVLPDARRLVLHESAHPHGSDPLDPRHRYLLCDLDDHRRLTPLTEELGPTAPAVSPDGRYLYYARDQIGSAGRLALRRLELATGQRDTIVEWDRPPLAGDWRFMSCYPLSTIRSDGGSIVFAVGMLARGAAVQSFGLLVVDLATAESQLIHLGEQWLNPHPQYSRSRDPVAMHDLLVQHNHDNTRGADGKLATPLGPLGCDIHLIRDDGTQLRDIPVGRDGVEYCQGHQCWRGESDWLLIGTGTAGPSGADAPADDWLQPMIECRATAGPSRHLGRATPDAVRQDISASAPTPDFRHFATDRLGQRLVSDCGPYTAGGELWLADLAPPGSGPAAWRYLLDLGCTNHSPAHSHPFLSPDGHTAFFNSDASGLLRAYCLTGL